MEKFDYLVVGSGLYGSIFAHEAKAHGKSVLVVDKRPNIAGNIYTENIEGINVHKYGAHIFHKGKNNTVVYTPHGYAHILMGPGKKSKVYKFAEKVLGNRALTLTCCESEDEEAKKFSKRTAYVETGVNLADLSTSLDGIKPVKNDRFTVFTLGRACVQKQPQLFNKIAELVPDVQLPCN